MTVSAMWRLPYGDRPASSTTLTAWTRPGELVADLDDDPELAALCAERNRRCHTPTARELVAADRTPPWADLVVLSWPRWPVNPYELLVGGRSLLNPGRHVVSIVTSAASLRPGHIQALVGCAGHVGLLLERRISVVS